MDKYKLTVTFSDGEVTVETFRTELGLERAIRWWKDCEVADQKNGQTYSITSMESEELELADA